jgi:hypothetical protein
LIETVVTDGLVSVTNLFSVVVTEAVEVPAILSLAVTNGEAIVTWSSESGEDYRLLYKDNIDDVSWTGVEPAITAASTTVTVTNLVGSLPQRYFRVERLP